MKEDDEETVGRGHRRRLGWDRLGFSLRRRGKGRMRGKEILFVGIHGVWRR